MSEFKFTNAAKYFIGEEHQIDAFEYLQENTSPQVFSEFERRYKNKKRVPESGIELIKNYEKCKLEAYPDPKTKGKPYTIGWGSTRKKDGTPFRLGEKITQQEADDLFDYQIKTEFIPRLERIPYWNEMNENQQGAILSFSYNLGANFYGSFGFNTITKVLKEKKWNDVPKAFELYIDPGTDVEEGLLRRRKEEGALWRKK